MEFGMGEIIGTWVECLGGISH